MLESILRNLHEDQIYINEKTELEQNKLLSACV